MTVLVAHRADLEELGSPAGRSAVIMTMGALHDGHAALVRAGRGLVGAQGRVLVTVFVNPRQFGAGEDFARYPRTLEEDIAIAGEAGADVVFAPDVTEVYPPEGTPAAAITVEPGRLGSELEGAIRPGHFAGVLTVVAKLLHMTRPDLALFGEKDYQQLVLIRAMAQALDFPVDIVGIPTVREADGLAMSSRNRYLSSSARDAASAIPRALRVGQEHAAGGAQAVESVVRRALEEATASAAVPMTVDYVAVRSLDLGAPPRSGEARLLTAFVVDGTRLLDNLPLTLGAP